MLRLKAQQVLDIALEKSLVATMITYLQPRERRFLGCGRQHDEEQRHAPIHHHPSLTRVNVALPYSAGLRTAQAYEAIVVAAIDQSFLTGTASAIIDDGLDDDPVARMDITDALPNRFHVAAKFMANCQGYHLLGDGVRRGGHDAGPSKILMEVFPEHQRRQRCIRQSSGRTCSADPDECRFDLSLVSPIPDRSRTIIMP